MAKIDPSFQAAPILQISDPTSLIQQQKQNQFQMQQAQYEQGKQETTKGLEDLTTELKGWEDQSGFNELLERNNTVKDVYMKARKMGLELNNPKTSDEVKTYKAINDYHQQTAQLADQWNQQKTFYDKVQNDMIEDSKLPPAQQKIDHEKTQANLEEVLKGKSIGERSGLIEKAVVPKFHIDDVTKYMASPAIQKQITQPPKVQTKQPDGTYLMTDGQMTPDIVKKNLTEVHNLWRTMSPEFKQSIKETRANDPEDVPNEDGVKMSDSEYLYSYMYNPKYKQEFIEKESGKGGFNIDIGGQHMKLDSPGAVRKNSIVFGTHTYNDHVDFDSKSVVNVNLEDIGAKGIIGNQEMPVTGGNNTPCELLHYLPKENAFVFRAKNPPIGSQIQNGETFIIPKDKLGGKFDNLPVTVDGKQKLLKDIGGDTSEKKEIPGVSWSKPAYIPKAK